MKKYISMIVLSMVLLPFFTIAQNTFPDFTFGNVQISLPISMVYIQSDSTNINGDDLVYNLTGQMFNINNGEGHIQTISEGFSGVTDRSTPWKTLTELLAAYQNNDFNAVKSLFTAAGQDSIDIFLPTPADITQYMSQTSTIQSIDIYCAYELEGRIIAHTKIPQFDGVMPFFFEEVNGQYLVSTTVDASATSWNIGLHCMHNPQPILTPDLISQPDTIYSAYDTLGNLLNVQTDTMSFQMNTPENYLTFFTFSQNPGEEGYVLIRIKEGSSTDIAPAFGTFSFEINGNGFPEGDITLYAVESNYPIDAVTQEMIDNALEFYLHVSIDF